MSEVRHPVKMVIEVTPDGDIKVECNQLRNQMYCLGLLEQAKLVIIQFNMMKSMEKKVIQAPNPLTINKLMGR